MNIRGPGRPKRQADSGVTPPVQDALYAAPSFRTEVDDLVAVGGGRAAILVDLVQAAFEAHERELFSHALRATKDREVAADLVQEAFLRLIGELRAGRRPDDVRPWLYRVLTNLIVSRSRHKGAVDRWVQTLRRTDDREESTAEGDVIETDTRHELELAIAQLAPDARIAVLLAARGFDGPMIASQLGRSQAATRTLLCRARMQLRRHLQDADRDD
jgi:RNA polymerase sigma-70 factor, ECF subfamily